MDIAFERRRWCSKYSAFSRLYNHFPKSKNRFRLQRHYSITKRLVEYADLITFQSLLLVDFNPRTPAYNFNQFFSLQQL